MCILKDDIFQQFLSDETTTHASEDTAVSIARSMVKRKPFLID